MGWVALFSSSGTTGATDKNIRCRGMRAPEMRFDMHSMMACLAERRHARRKTRRVSYGDANGLSEIREGFR